MPSAAAVRSALEELLARTRASGAMVVHVQNDGGPGDPDEPGADGWHLVFPPAEGELVVRKDVPDTFAAQPGLADDLTGRGVTTVVVAGMQSDHCVDATARAALSRGFAVHLVAGAHATYDAGRAARGRGAGRRAGGGDARRLRSGRGGMVRVPGLRVISQGARPPPRGRTQLPRRR